MANPEHLNRLIGGGERGPERWNQWRQENPEVIPDLTDAFLSRAIVIGGVDLAKVDLSGATLNGATLCGVDLSEARLSKANLAGADLSGTRLVQALLDSVNLFGANLCEATLNRANLDEADLRSTNFMKADLSATTLTGALLHHSNLQEAVLSWADLTWADLGWADLTKANMARAELGWADFTGASLVGADLTGAHLTETVFADTNLREAQGLGTCRHTGPSTIDHRTLGKSGLLPLAFLRGCGLPDLLIDYLPSLLNDAIQFYSCFISYSTEDQQFAERLHADLQNNSVRCWFAPHQIQGGKKIHEQIDDAIHMYDRLLLILSDHSMKSSWVKTEIAKARKRELRERRRMLFPVRLVEFERLRDWTCFDADTGSDSAQEIREYFIPDFSEWKDHDKYKAAFDGLLRDLKATDRGTETPA